MIQTIYLVVALGVLLFGWWCWQDYNKHKHNKIPGIGFRFPIVGNIPQMLVQSTFPNLAFLKLSRIYGDVIYVVMGAVTAVVFNTPESVKEIFNSEHANDRTITMLPMIYERVCGQSLGLIFGSGDHWNKLRRFTIRTLREFGFGKAANIDVAVKEELEKFMNHLDDKIKKSSDGAVEIEGMFDLTFVNILWRLVTGINYAMDDARMAYLLKLSNEMALTAKFSLDLSAAFPYLWHLFPNWMEKNKQIVLVKELQAFCRETLEHHRKTADYMKNPNCYVDVFLQNIEKNKGVPDTEFTDDQACICLLDLFQGGSDTSSKTLAFATLYMMLNPTIQEKVQKELDDVLGDDGELLVEMRNKLPYTHATVVEIFRYGLVGPFPPPRLAQQDFYFRNYYIKKGTILLPNSWGVHFDDKLWGDDPNTFRPERFIKPDNTVDSILAQKITTFGGGKRACIGQHSAEVTVFMYFAALMRKFKVVKPAGAPIPSTVPVKGLTYSAQPFRACFIPRK